MSENNNVWSTYWRTSIGFAGENEILVRGYPLEEIIGRLSYSEGVMLVLKGRLPDESETKVLDAVLVCLLDHGFISATVPAARFVASANPSVQAGVAAGVLAMGKNAVSPAHACALIDDALARRDAGRDADEVAAEIVAEYRAEKRRLPGFGHPSHTDGDPRAVRIEEVAAEAGFVSDRLDIYKRIHAQFVEQSGRGDIPINIDGMMAAVLPEMGFTPDEITVLAMLSYLPGIAAHVLEEINDGVPLRIIPPTTSVYEGPARRSLDTAAPRPA
jgi:citrate synthase